MASVRGALSARTIGAAADAVQNNSYRQFESSNSEMRRVTAAQGEDITQKYDVFGTNSYPTTDNQWAGFFGAPNSPWKTASYDKYDRHNWNLPEAYVGKNETLADTITEMIYTEETFYTTVLLPLTYNDNLHIKWDKWEFNSHFTGVVPEQGISRLVSSHREERSDSIIRRGIGFMAEHGFMSTPEGRAHYFLTLAQIARAVRETNNFGVVYALLTCHQYSKEWEAKHGYFKKNTLENILERENFMWSITTKSKNGFEKLDAQIVEWMDAHRTSADTWLLPPKPAMYLRLVPAEKTDYYLAGPMGPDRVNNIVGAGRPHESNAKRTQDIVEPYAVFKKNTVYLTRSYDVAKTGPIDLMTRVSTLGEYFKILPLLGNHDFRKSFKSSHTDTRIYDEDSDAGFTVNMLDAVRNSMVFKADGTPNNVEFPATVSDSDLAQCFFLKKNGDKWNQIDYMGDIDKEFLRTEDVVNIAHCAANAIVADTGSTITNNLRTGIKSIYDALQAGQGAGAAVTWNAIEQDPNYTNFVSALQTVISRAGQIFGGGRNAFLSGGATPEESFYNNFVAGNLRNIYVRNGVISSSMGDAAVPTPNTYKYALGGLNATGKSALAERLGSDLSTATYGNTATIIEFMESNIGMTNAKSADGLAKWIGDLRSHGEKEVEANRSKQSAAAQAAVTYTLTDRMIAADHPSVLDGSFERQGYTLSSRFDSSRPAEVGSVLGNPGESKGFMNSRFARDILGAKMASERGSSASSGRFGASGSLRGTGLHEMFDEEEDIGALYRTPKERDAGVARRRTDINILPDMVATRVDDLLKSSADPLVKMIAQLFFGAPWNFDTLANMYANDIVLPCGVLGFRIGTYAMALGIKMKAGASTGQTYYTKSRFELGDDPVIMMHYGNFTHYGKSIVYRPEQVFVAYDIFPNQCKGGMGIRPYDSKDKYTPSEDIYRGDIFYVLVPFRETNFDKAMSMAGRFYTYMDAGLVDENDPNNRVLHYSTAAYYNQIWGWYAPENVLEAVDEPLYRLTSPSQHQVVWQGAQGTYNPSKEDFTKNIIRNKSPWGPNVCEGFTRAARDGRMETVPEVPNGVLGF